MYASAGGPARIHTYKTEATPSPGPCGPPIEETQATNPTKTTTPATTARRDRRAGFISAFIHPKSNDPSSTRGLCLVPIALCLRHQQRNPPIATSRRSGGTT